jgi:hypothetical protein
MNLKLKPAVKAVAETLHRSLFSYLQRMGLVLSAAHTAVEGFSDGSGTTYAISATLPATYDAAGYGATTITYTTIGKVESFPEFGSTRNVAQFRPISGPIEKVKGSPDYGGGQMVMADVPADAGQVLLKAAEASANHYSLKLTFPDGEVHYLDVINSGWRLQQAQEGGILKRVADLQLCKAPVVIAAP